MTAESLSVEGPVSSEQRVVYALKLAGDADGIYEATVDTGELSEGCSLPTERYYTFKEARLVAVEHICRVVVAASPDSSYTERAFRLNDRVLPVLGLVVTDQTEYGRFAQEAELFCELRTASSLAVRHAMFIGQGAAEQFLGWLDVSGTQGQVIERAFSASVPPVGRLPFGSLGRTN